MDGSMQLGMARGLAAPAEERNAGARVPAGIAAFAVQAPGSMAQRRLQAVAAFDASTARSSISNHYLIDASVVGAAMRGLEAKVMPRQAGGVESTSAASGLSAPPEAQALYSLQWQAATACSGDEGEVEASVALALSGARPARLSGSPIAVSVRGRNPLATFAGGADLFGALHSAPPFGVVATTSGARSVLSGSAGLHGEVDVRSLSSGVFLGLLRTVGSEVPQLSLLTADSDASAPSAGVSGAAALAPAASRPLTRAGETYMARLLPSAAFPSVGCVQMQPLPRGSLASLVPVAIGPESGVTLPAGVVEIAVRAVGLNFRDVLNVLGMYPGHLPPPGGDFAGTLLMGSTAGTAAFGLAPGCLGTYIVTLGSLVSPKPAAVPFEQAASLPTVCTTVDVALRMAAGRGHRAGDCVLVHGAAGGVGLALLSSLGHTGARCLGTAGGGRKRSFVRSLGVDAVAGSRDTTFAGDISLLSMGVGVDAILNSLTSAGMVPASLATLGRGGSFVEISKIGVWSRGAASTELADVNYGVMAMDFVPPAPLGRVLRSLAVALSRGLLRPMAGVAHSLGATRSALRQMSQARHVGKIVVRVRGLDESGLDGSRSALVTGGTGALGSLVGFWLARSGATGHLTLAARPGDWQRSSRAALRRLLALSSSLPLSVVRCDVAVRAELVALDRHVGAPMCGTVMHAGGLLQDATLGNQTVGGGRHVFAPKVDGVARLSLTLGLQPLSTTVLFSSTASLMGSPGQANYAAANAALDAWASRSSDSGLVGMSINWGAWLGGGMSSATTSRMSSMGMGVVEPAFGLRLLGGLLLSHSVGNVAANPFEWSRLLPLLGKAPVYDEFQPEAGGGRDTSGRPDAGLPLGGMAATLSAVPSEQRVAFITGEVSTMLRALVGSEVGLDEPLMDAGLDSLGAVEFKNAVEGRMGVELSATVVFDYPTISALASYITRKIEASLPSPGGKAADVAVAPLALEARVPGFLGAKILSTSAITASGDLEAEMLDGVAAAPMERWDQSPWELLLGDGTYPGASFGAFVAEPSVAFDEAVFGINHTEAILMDPQQRLMLNTLEGALAVVRDRSSLSALGVFGASLAGEGGHPILPFDMFLFRIDIPTSFRSLSLVCENMRSGHLCFGIRTHRWATPPGAERLHGHGLGPQRCVRAAFVHVRRARALHERGHRLLLSSGVRALGSEGHLGGRVPRCGRLWHQPGPRPVYAGLLCAGGHARQRWPLQDAGRRGGRVRSRRGLRERSVGRLQLVRARRDRQGLGGESGRALQQPHRAERALAAGRDCGRPARGGREQRGGRRPPAARHGNPAGRPHRSGSCRDPSRTAAPAACIGGPQERYRPRRGAVWTRWPASGRHGAAFVPPEPYPAPAIGEPIRLPRREQAARCLGA